MSKEKDREKEREQRENSKVGRFLTIIVRFVMFTLGSVAGYQLASYLVSKKLLEPEGTSAFLFIGAVVVLLGCVGFLLTPLFIRLLLLAGIWSDNLLQGVPLSDVAVGIVGLIFGLLIANLIAWPLANLPLAGSVIPLPLNVLLGFLGLRLAIKKKDDIQEFFSSIPRLKNRLGGKFRDKISKAQKTIIEGAESPSIKILDTSVIIDGRILDVAKTGYLEGLVYVPRFVINELQQIADSSVPLRRNRGRRGLDVLNSLQSVPNISIHVSDLSDEFVGNATVDESLIKLAKEMDAKVVTNDYNLNKIAKIHGVFVLNINDLANALKPVVLPGEEMTVDVIREGKDASQGVAYLDDGTMVVVEDGGDIVGQRVSIQITSILQTSAGRMIFGRQKRGAEKR